MATAERPEFPWSILEFGGQYLPERSEDWQRATQITVTGGGIGDPAARDGERYVPGPGISRSGMALPPARQPGGPAHDHGSGAIADG